MSNSEDNNDNRTETLSFTMLAKEHQQRKNDGESSDSPFAQLGLASNAAGQAAAEGDERTQLYERAMNYLAGVYRAARAGQAFSLAEGSAIVEEMVRVSHKQNFLFIEALHLSCEGVYINNHPVNVAILTVKLSGALGYSRNELVELGLTALLHDVGSVMIPEELFHKTGELTRKDIETLKQRPNYSYQILSQFEAQHPYLAETALQVHERIDGTGYPKGLKGEEINDYAQIIGLVDVYEAMIHNRPQREKFLHFTAIKEIIRKEKNRFQRKYLKALLNIFSIFPIYSYVRLNSGAIGRVIETYPEQPMRPKIRLIYDSQRDRLLTERIIDLPEHPLLYIIDSVDESEIEDFPEKERA